LFLKLKLWLRDLLAGSASKNSRTKAETMIRLDNGQFASVDHPSVRGLLPVKEDCGCGHCDCK
jgi:hypothetical protein